MGVDSLAATVRARRRRLGLTQEEVAALAGTSRQTVNALEGGAAGVSMGRAAAICDALGLRLTAIDERTVPE